MTPKEKAKELVEKFKNRSVELGHSHSQLLAEANALIAVDELIKQVTHSYVGYWKEVKQEIQKL